MKVRILTGIASVEKVLQIDEIVDMPEKMARAYAAEGAVKILSEEVKAEPGTRRVARKSKAE
jgi:hypothetical protein